MIYAVIGATGWTLAEVMNLTFAQLDFAIAGQGQMLYPKLQIQISDQWSQVSSAKRDKEPESDIQRIIREHKEAEERHKNGLPPKTTLEQEERALAFRLLYKRFLPPEEEQVRRHTVLPIEGFSPRTARAIVAHYKESGIPDDIVAYDLAPVLLALSATAALP